MEEGDIVTIHFEDAYNDKITRRADFPLDILKREVTTLFQRLTKPATSMVQ
jgi:hypothetical protein